MSHTKDRQFFSWLWLFVLGLFLVGCFEPEEKQESSKQVEPIVTNIRDAEIEEAVRKQRDADREFERTRQENDYQVRSQQQENDYITNQMENETKRYEADLDRQAKVAEANTRVAIADTTNNTATMTTMIETLTGLSTNYMSYQSKLKEVAQEEKDALRKTQSEQYAIDSQVQMAKAGAPVELKMREANIFEQMIAANLSAMQKGEALPYEWPAGIERDRNPSQERSDESGKRKESQKLRPETQPE